MCVECVRLLESVFVCVWFVWVCGHVECVCVCGILVCVGVCGFLEILCVRLCAWKVVVCVLVCRVYVCRMLVFK